MIQFVKMHGAGNDFVCLDLIAAPENRDWAAAARDLCDRRFGVGADGILLIEKGDIAPFRMRMFNPDGTEAEMCGNGTRCVGRFLVDKNYAPMGQIPLEVFGRVVQLDVGEEDVSVDMGVAEVLDRELVVTLPSGDQLQGTSVNVGNPHFVLFVDDLASVPLTRWGRAIETLPQFPAGTNVHFAQIDGDHEVTVMHWERGAGATLACGSGACAVAAAYVNPTGRVLLHLPGGDVTVVIDDRGHAIKTGPAETVFTGTYPGV